MAKRTQERHQGVEAAPQGPPEKQRPFWLGWIAFAVVVAVVVGLVWVMYVPHHQPTTPLPGSQTSNPPTAVPPTQLVPSVGPAPATTYDDFAALPSPQQQAVMEQAIHHYFDVTNEAFRTLNPALLPQVATGGELPVLQQALQKAIQNHQPDTEQDQITILRIVLSPRPYTFISIDTQGTSTQQYLDPTSLQPIGSPTTTSGHSSFSLVIENGVWKVSEHIQEQAAK
jgi:hypothetical protein